MFSEAYRYTMSYLCNVDKSIASLEFEFEEDEAYIKISFISKQLKAITVSKVIKKTSEDGQLILKELGRLVAKRNNLDSEVDFIGYDISEAQIPVWAGFLNKHSIKH